MGFLAFTVVVAGLVVGYLKRDDAYVLTISIAVSAYALAHVVSKLAELRGGFFWPILLSRTVFWRADVRVSVAYLISIPVEDTQLLVKGHRITSQFQPVGGVFKTRINTAELSRRFNARPDIRFTPDETSARDMRLRLRGKELLGLLKWFESRQERELFPWREFHEELIATGILRKADFPFFDCSFLGTRHFPFEFDKYSQCRQLIIAEIYELIPTARQATALSNLRRRQEKDPVGGIYFATREEIERGAVAGGSQATFDIARTARWLVDKT